MDIGVSMCVGAQHTYEPLLNNAAGGRQRLGEARLLVRDAGRNKVQVSRRQGHIFGHAALPGNDAEDSAPRVVVPG